MRTEEKGEYNSRGREESKGRENVGYSRNCTRRKESRRRAAILGQIGEDRNWNAAKFSLALTERGGTRN